MIHTETIPRGADGIEQLGSGDPQVRDTAFHMQLVLMARAEAMLPQASAGGNIGSAVEEDDTAGMPRWMLPRAATN